MHDIDALLNSLVNIDRNSLIAIFLRKPKPPGGLRIPLDCALLRSALNGTRPNCGPLGSTASCPSSSGAISQRPCLRATSNFANPSNKSCVRGANLATRRPHKVERTLYTCDPTVRPGGARRLPTRRVGYAGMTWAV